MVYYPVFLKMDGVVVLVVGGGRVSERKVETLIECGASVRIVARELTHRLRALVEGGFILWIGQEYEELHLDGVALVFSATNDSRLNHKVSQGAIRRGILVNAVDQPEDCSFIVPSIVRRKDLTIAISTSGKSPALAKAIRRQLEHQFGKEYEAFLDLMGRLRKEVLSAGFSQEENSRIFHNIVDSDILKALAEYDWQSVEAELRRILPPTLDLKHLLSKEKL
ncbi:Siroheme synthase domain protein [uncultured Desulfobacterium sp.]|uniref:precorrin-2 dehydrogenase n=1 Tax=uncultured Desulfobacterium sp. TaxID=201089 RepID=A0A445N332_9BACT|nr:Siroheme synthase domain protein [uncultured Desulfobacterium sp.]